MELGPWYRVILFLGPCEVLFNNCWEASQPRKEKSIHNFFGCVIRGIKKLRTTFSFFPYPSPFHPYAPFSFPFKVPSNLSMTTTIRTLPGTTIWYYSISRLMVFTSSTDCWGHRGVCDMISSFNGPSIHIYVASIGFIDIPRKHSRQLRSRHARWCGRHRKRYLPSRWSMLHDIAITQTSMCRRITSSSCFTIPVWFTSEYFRLCYRPHFYAALERTTNSKGKQGLWMRHRDVSY